eukprot:m.689682 g.689682  ORF g.689682 m.689682 type:complete len:496 (+) comp22847_c0_seq26:115-1602(+)
MLFSRFHSILLLAAVIANVDTDRTVTNTFSEKKKVDNKESCKLDDSTESKWWNGPPSCVTTGVTSSVHKVSSQMLPSGLFDRYAVTGQPLHILDASALSENFHIAGWTCEKFATEFPEATMYTEYSIVSKLGELVESTLSFIFGGSNIDDFPSESYPVLNWIIRSVNEISMGDHSWTYSTVEQAPPVKMKAQQGTSDSPRFGPYYWDPVKSEGRKQPESVASKLRRLVSPLNFMRQSSRNIQDVHNTMEFWFAPVNGSGALGHMDPHCDTTLSIQLSGEKRWRLGFPPLRIPVSPDDRESEDWTGDGQYVEFAQPGSASWVPAFEVTVHAGEALLFPMGMIHETLNTAPSSCSASITVQFGDPLPARFYRHFLPQLTRTGSLIRCWDYIESIATLSTVPAQLLKGPHLQRACEDTSSDVFRAIDRDSNNGICTAEVVAYIEQRRASFELSQDVLAEAVINYHDDDENAIVTEEEFSRGYCEWVANEIAIKNAFYE